VSDQIPECKKAFDCLECDDADKCKKWNEHKEREKDMALELAEEMPILIEYFGFCALKEGNIKDWQKKLEELAFGC